MSRYFRNSLSCPFLFLAVSVLSATPLWGVKPAEELLPATTKLYVSLPNVEAVRAKFEKTQLGELARDPVMKPFAEDLGRQLRERLGNTTKTLGLDWDDLEGVYGGEACFAMIQPDNDPGKHATALLVDVTNHPMELEKVWKSIDDNMQQREATKRIEPIESVDVTIYQLPKRTGELDPRQVLLCVINDQFIAIDNLEVAKHIIRRSAEDSEDPLNRAEVFASVMSRLAEESNGLDPHVRWYVDPFGFAEVLRASNGGRKRRGQDMLKILKNQGFQAVQALGGHVNLATDGREVLHRTLVHAPPVTDEPTKYLKAARMLAFPNSQHLPIPNWIPRNLATYLSWNWKIREAFEHSISLVDEIVDSEGFVDDVLSSFERDATGPQINVRTELLDFLDERVLVFSDFKLPISAKSERLLAAIRVKDPDKVARALQKLWQTDPQARERRLGEQVVWEIVPEEEDAIPDLEITGVPVLGGESFDEDDESVHLPNAAMTVAHGYLLVASHVDFLESVMSVRPTHDTLGDSIDFRMVNSHLERLGAANDSFRFFSRTDEEYRGTYEMIRQGKMPESESLLGKLLNRLLGPEEDGVLRKQRLDGKSLPDYQVVRRYLGPAGLFVTTREDGWLVTGIMLSKQNLEEESVARAPLKTAAADHTSP